MKDLLELGKFATILADPPWLFDNRTGKMAPEHKRLFRYSTMTNQEIMAMPVSQLALPKSHLYLWVPNALVKIGLEVMEAWGFTYKTNLVWYKTRRDGGPDRRGVGFYFRNGTELVLFGVRGSFRTLAPGRRMPNIIVSRKREHSRKPEELYEIVEQCSPAPHLELFARHARQGWVAWGNEIDDDEPVQTRLFAYPRRQSDDAPGLPAMATLCDAPAGDFSVSCSPSAADPLRAVAADATQSVEPACTTQPVPPPDSEAIRS